MRTFVSLALFVSLPEVKQVSKETYYRGKRDQCLCLCLRSNKCQKRPTTEAKETSVCVFA